MLNQTLKSASSSVEAYYDKVEDRNGVMRECGYFCFRDVIKSLP